MRYWPRLSIYDLEEKLIWSILLWIETIHEFLKFKKIASD